MLRDKEKFLSEFEKRLATLKATFTIPVTPEWQNTLQHFKLWRNEYQPSSVAVNDFSSLFAVPTTELIRNEQILHRIWLGGTLPKNVILTIKQWQQAIAASNDNFRQTLWVWDAQQLEADAGFILQSGEDPLQIGVLFLSGTLVCVNSLARLLQPFDNTLSFMLQQLHSKGYYATLSDFFRLAILVEYGGVYLDADTLPAPPATLFLCKPELPDFIGEKKQNISWLNLYLDETGMIISHRDNLVIRYILEELSDIYRNWPKPLTDKQSCSERAIFEPFYKLWREQLGVTQLSHQDFSQKYSIYGFEQVQERICGIKGMRLQEDIYGGARCELSTEELKHYHNTVQQLSQRNWTLIEPLELADIAPLFNEREVLRIAYAPQLRAEIPYYHYYGVLSQDEQLDKVNSLFCNYLIALNQTLISYGYYWEPVRLKTLTPLWFIPGGRTSKEEQRVMAKLMLTTSYLEYCSVDNIFSLDIITLQLRQNIEPFLPFITALYDQKGKMVGFLNAAKIIDYDTVSVEFAYRNHVRPLEDAYERFVATYSREDDFFICSVALLAEEQGKGYFGQILCRLTQEAKKQGLSRITLCVWKSNNAWLMYLKKGFIVVGSMQQEFTRFSDELLFMTLKI